MSLLENLLVGEGDHIYVMETICRNANEFDQPDTFDQTTAQEHYDFSLIRVATYTKSGAIGSVAEFPIEEVAKVIALLKQHTDHPMYAARHPSFDKETDISGDVEINRGLPNCPPYYQEFSQIKAAGIPLEEKYDGYVPCDP
jgi:hypothetical protein